MTLPKRFGQMAHRPPADFDTKAYLEAVGQDKPDLRWLSDNVCNNPELTVQDRRWLANQELASESSLLTHAVHVSSQPLLDFLLNEGANPYTLDPFNPVHAAIETRNVRAMEKLCAYPAANEDERRMLGALLYFEGVQTCMSGLCKPMIQAGADLTFWMERPNQTPLYAAVYAYEKLCKAGIPEDDARVVNMLGIIDDMMIAGANPRQGQGNGPTAYDLAMTIVSAYGDSGPAQTLQRFNREEPAEEMAEQALQRIMRNVSMGRKPPRAA